MIVVYVFSVTPPPLSNENTLCLVDVKIPPTRKCCIYPTRCMPSAVLLKRQSVFFSFSKMIVIRVLRGLQCSMFVGC